MDTDIKEKGKLRLPPFIAFPALFLLSFGAWGTVNSYWPVYFNSFGYSNTQIGVLTAVGPFAALFGLLFWGVRTDRARYRNNVLILICVILGVSSQLYLLNGAFFYTFALTIVFKFCFYSVNPSSDAMFLEQVQKGNITFWKGRVWGGVGLALLPLLPGLAISRWGIRSVFPSYLLFVLLIIIIVLQMPKMRGGQSSGEKKTTVSALRHDKEFVGLFCFLFLLHATLGFYYSFFPVYMDNLGATDLIGLNNLAQFCMEVVFIIAAVKLVRRFGFARLFCVAFALTAARMLLIGSISSPALLIVVNLFTGPGYSMCMFLFSFFALRAPKELRTSAQMMNTLVAHSLSRFFGSMLGGALSDIFGIGSVFLYAGLFNVLLLSGFVLWLRKTSALRDPLLM